MITIEDRKVAPHESLLRQLAGAGLCTNRLLFRTFCQHPLQVYWVDLVYHFWNLVAEAGCTVYPYVFHTELRTAFLAPRGQDGCIKESINVFMAEYRSMEGCAPPMWVPVCFCLGSGDGRFHTVVIGSVGYHLWCSVLRVFGGPSWNLFLSCRAPQLALIPGR